MFVYKNNNTSCNSKDYAASSIPHMSSNVRQKLISQMKQRHKFSFFLELVKSEYSLACYTRPQRLNGQMAGLLSSQSLALQVFFLKFRWTKIITH